MLTYKTIITTKSGETLEITAPTPLETLRIKYAILNDPGDIYYGPTDGPTVLFASRDNIARIEYVYYDAEPVVLND